MTDLTEDLAQAIVKNGYRLTSARQVIIKTLVTCEGHISADELAAKVHQTAPQVGRMTVYRTLELLNELGVVHPIYQGTAAAHYILMRGGSHHHFICSSCNEVIEFDECTAGELMRELAERFRLQIVSHLLELHGLCSDCLLAAPSPAA